MRPRKVIVFGGSFNPVHNGHVLVARAVLESVAADEVLFVPCASSAYGKILWPASMRWDLLKRALRGQKGLRASKIEIDRGGISRTVETLRELKTLHPTAKFFLLLGADQASQVGSWKDWSEIKKLAKLLWVARDGFIPSPKMGGLVLKKIPRYEISSTTIRKRLRNSLDIGLLVPGSVHVKLLKIRGKK